MPTISKRRAGLAAAASVALAALGGQAQAQVRAQLPARGPATVALLGDSITTGYGLPARDSLPVKLQAELTRLGAQAKVRAAGVVGDTTAGGVVRVDRAAEGAELCVVALGGNDLLQGVEPARLQANLERIVRRLKARGVKVVLAGVKVPPVLQGGYAASFNAAFAQVARREGVLFVPDMLAGVTLNPDLNQRDGIHPNAAGVQLIARRLAPVVASGLVAR
jgi:acyl-CoA thioesterase-1